jgi:16S rRNA (adenine1518-N6/adenine1519-N6)-dimethyltransferase
MKLSEMKQVLATEKIQLTKSLGQNFLHDSNQLHRIIAAAQLSSSDKILEIGPGLGPLTELLLRDAGHVLAIEKDKRLLEFLQHRFGKSPKLELRHDDALDFVQQQPDLHDWKVVSNLPYSVASPILVELARSPKSPQMIVVTLQIEVAQRISALHGAKDYGLLSLLTQLRYEVKGQFKIRASCFFPEPDVNSACITLARREQPLLDHDAEQVFGRIVKRAFSQRRKMMLKLLKEDWPEDQLRSLFTQLRLDQRARAETISLNQFAELARQLS